MWAWITEVLLLLKTNTKANQCVTLNLVSVHCLTGDVRMQCKRGGSIWVGPRYAQLDFQWSKNKHVLYFKYSGGVYFVIFKS